MHGISLKINIIFSFHTLILSRESFFSTFIRPSHIYGDATATTKNSPLYVPANLNGTAPKFLLSYTGETDNATIIGKVTFKSGPYKESTMWSNRFIFQYNNGLTILFAHVVGGGGELSNSRNLAGSYQIGLIGGPGGISALGGYVHSHLAFWRNGKKINPRIEFCAGGSKF